MSMSEQKNFIRLLIGSGENCADIRYATNISTPDDFIWLGTGDGSFALLSSLEIDRGRAQKKSGVTVLPESDFGVKRLDILRAAAIRFNADGFEVPENFPLFLADSLRETGIAVRSVPAPFFPEREFKSVDEMELVTRSQRAGECGFARAVEVLKECGISADRKLLWQGEILTSEILRNEIDCAMLRLGMLPTGTICAGSLQSAQPHNVGSGPLSADRPIVLDIFPRSGTTGYWGDLTRTVVKGKPAEIVRRAYDAVLEARETAKSRIAIGSRGVDLHNAAQAVLDRHGFYTGNRDGSPFGFFHGLGHGVGLEIHEAPRLSPRSPSILKGGEIVTVEPGVYYPEWGGIRLEDLIYLDRDGKVHCLTQAPDFLVID